MKKVILEIIIFRMSTIICIELPGCIHEYHDEECPKYPFLRDHGNENSDEEDYAEGDYDEGDYAEGDYDEGDYDEGDYDEGDYDEWDSDEWDSDEED